MTAEELFYRLSPLVGPSIEQEFGRRDLCILATRIVIDVAAYFGIEVVPVPVRVFLANAAFAKHVDEGDYDVHKWAEIDGSHSVGCGFGGDPDQSRKWHGHLIAAANGCFGDFSIRQAERIERGIVTGDAIVGPLPANGPGWRCENGAGTRVEYLRIDDDAYLTAPDWREPKRRRRIVGALIRAGRV